MSANLRQPSASCPLTVREFVNRSVPRSGTHAMTTYIFLLCLARFLAHSVPETLCEHVTFPQWPTDAGTEPRVPRNPFCYTGTFPWIQGRRNRTQESFGSALPSDHSPSSHRPCMEEIEILEEVNSNLTCSECYQRRVVEDQSNTGYLQSSLCFSVSVFHSFSDSVLKCFSETVFQCFRVSMFQCPEFLCFRVSVFLCFSVLVFQGFFF